MRGRYNGRRIGKILPHLPATVRELAAATGDGSRELSRYLGHAVERGVLVVSGTRTERVGNRLLEVNVYERAPGYQPPGSAAARRLAIAHLTKIKWLMEGTR